MSKRTPFVPSPTPHPIAVSQLDFAGRPLGQGNKDVIKSAQHR